jgi:hypothetical protein
MKPRLVRWSLVAAVAATGVATLSPAPAPASAATWSLTDLNATTPVALAQELAGPGVTVTGATFTGDPLSGGLFSGPGVDAAIGVSDGVVLSSGYIDDVRGPNDTSAKGESTTGTTDPQLDLLAGDNTNDTAALTFTFIPSSPDLEINYVFASEEYSEFVDEGFNDVFGFFVNGVNCATVASTGGPQPVSVDTINHLRNQQIYVDNSPGDAAGEPSGEPAYDTQFDGFTQVLTCFAAVNPGVENTVKLAIADAGDSAYDSAVFLESSGVTSTPKTKYSPLPDPQRAYDSRSAAKPGAGAVVNIPMRGLNGVPADAVSVALNVTADAAEADGFLTVYPGLEPLPTASNVNYRTGGAHPNLVVAKIGTDGSINVYTDKPAHIIVDVFGYFSTTALNGFLAVTPDRVLDTRSGAKPQHGATLTFQVAGKYNVPADAKAVVLNLTLDQPDAAGWAAVFAAGQPRPATSNINVAAGETRPNVVFAPVGANGQVSVYLDLPSHVIVDVLGSYSTASEAELFKPVKPKRIIDTRPSGVRIPAGGTIEVKVTDIAGVPSTATAVVLNVTATDTQGIGYLTVFPANVLLPPSSNVNYVAGQSIPNVVVSGVSPDGRVKIYSYAETHVIVDVAGWFG